MPQYPPFTTAGTVPASGELVLPFRTRGPERYRVEQVTNEMTPGSAAGASSCKLRLNGALISPLVPAADAASGDPPIYCGPGDELTVTWTGATAGGTGRMTVIYSLERP